MITSSPTTPGQEKRMGDVLAVITSTQGYDGLQKSLRARWLSLGIRGEDLDRLAGIAERYGAKLLGPWPVKHMGTDSLGRIMDVLAVKLVLVEDTEMLAEIERRLGSKLKRPMLQRECFSAKKRRPRKHYLKGCAEWGRRSQAFQVLKMSLGDRKASTVKARKARNVILSPERRSEIARIAARARWGMEMQGVAI